MLTNKRIEDCFKIFDKDGSGKITAEELKQILGGDENSGDAKIWKDLIKEVDKNGDGEVSDRLI